MGDERPTVAHVNYLFFHSTQSFIYFYLSTFRRVRPICLTRMPESPEFEHALPPALADDFYLYGADSGRSVGESIWAVGLALRRFLTQLPPRVAEPLLRYLHGSVVPRLRSDVDPRRYLDWAERIMRERRTRLIHAYFGPVGWRMLELKRRLGVPLVVSFLGDEVAPSVRSWWSWWIQTDSATPDWPARMRELLEEGDLFLVEGPYLRQRLIDMGGDPEKIAVQRIAIPVGRMPLRLPRREGKRIVLFAGRFCEQKGLLYALEAIRELRRERADFEFRVIGDEKLTEGGYAASVYSYVRDHGLKDCVRLLGFLNHSEYLEQMRQGDLFLHPSVVDAQGSSEGGAPTTILEAQAMGLPIVSTRHCDIPNVTLPDESALLVPERDSAALVRALRALFDDPARCEAMGRAGRRHMEAKHDIEKEAPALEERYFELLRGAARDRA